MLAAGAIAACRAAPASTTMPSSAPTALRAVLTDRRPMIYSAEATNPDRPAHVRAGSGLARFGGRLAVVQDDLNFIALVDDDGTVEEIALPAGPGGRYRFEEELGNRLDKADLECCVVVPTLDDELLLGFGSGSTDAREQIAFVAHREMRAHFVPAHGLYDRLRSETRFAGSELNIEGAALIPAAPGPGGTGRGEAGREPMLRLFQRGNGAPRGHLEPVNATVDLAAPARAPIPSLGSIRQHALGSLNGAPYGFTDATTGPGGEPFFLAGAERSPDAIQDGEIIGAAVGVLSSSGIRMTPLVDAEGAPVVVKAEGICFDGERRVLVVLDPDDPAQPAELCTVHLEGQW
jgi:hypothetical protein